MMSNENDNMELQETTAEEQELFKIEEWEGAEEEAATVCVEEDTFVLEPAEELDRLWSKGRVFFTAEYGRQVAVISALAVMTYLLVMYCSQSFFRNAEPGVDSSVFRYVALVMDKGGMPYADTFDHKGPLLYLINWLGLKLSYMKGIFYIEILFMFGTLTAMYRLARLFCGKLGACLTVAICCKWIIDNFQNGNFTEEYALLPIVVSTYIFLDYLLNAKVTKLRLMVCGFCFAAVCLLRINMIAIWIVFCAFIFFRSLLRKEYEALGKFVLYFVIGAAILAVPILIWLGANGALGDFIHDYFTFNLTYSSSEGGRATAAAKRKSFFFFFNQDIVIYMVLILLYFCFKEKKKPVSAVYLVYVVVMFLLISMSGMTYLHYELTMVPALVYPIALLMRVVETSYRKNQNPLSLVIVMYLLATLVLPTWLNAANNACQMYSIRKISNYTATARNIVKIIKENTDEDEGISVYGNWNLIYVLSKRLSVSEYSYQFPIGTIDTSIMEQYFEDLSETQPKVIVIQVDRMTEEMKKFLTENEYMLHWNEKADGSGSQVYLKQSAVTE